MIYVEMPRMWFYDRQPCQGGMSIFTFASSMASVILSMMCDTQLWRKAENSLFGEKNVCSRRVSAEDIYILSPNRLFEAFLQLKTWPNSYKSNSIQASLLLEKGRKQYIQWQCAIAPRTYILSPDRLFEAFLQLKTRPNSYKFQFYAGIITDW